MCELHKSNFTKAFLQKATIWQQIRLPWRYIALNFTYSLTSWWPLQGNKHIHVICMSFIQIDMAQVKKMSSFGRQGHGYPICLFKPQLSMTWWRTWLEQQQWYHLVQRECYDNSTRNVYPSLNYANPVYGIATICYQVRWLRWGHPRLFHTGTSPLIWYKMFCVRDVSYRLIWMEFINMFSVYAQSGTHSRFNW